MTTSTREITAASLSVSQDTGHGGGHYHYRIARRQEGYETSVTISVFVDGLEARRPRSDFSDSSVAVSSATGT